jgi:hypothetical protein
VIFSVTIAGGSSAAEVYGGLTAAAVYIGDRLGKEYTAWRVLSTDDRGRTLVMATQFIDLQGWPGTRTGLAGGTPTTLQWPRSGVTLADGTAVDSTIVPPEFVSATFELAVLIGSDPTVVAKVDQGSNIKAANAGGGVGVDYFNPTSAALGTAPRLPQVVAMLLGKFLATASSGAAVGGFGQSGNSRSDFATCPQIDDRTWPF